MNKRGIALIFGLIVAMVLLILSAAFFIKVVNESSWVKRYTNSTRALWFAEAGVAEAIKNLPSTASASNADFAYTVTLSSSAPTYQIYQIDSTGQVSMGGGNLTRRVEAFIKYSPPQTGSFANAVEVNGALDFGGTCKDGACITPSGSFNDYANLNFREKFSLQSEELKNIAQEQGTYYVNPPSPLQNLSGITWIDIEPPARQLKIPKTGWTGSGILVVNGETDMEGGTFDGIIWVIGELNITGNGRINGVIFSECNTSIDTDITGTPTINHDVAQIDSALNLLDPYAQKAIVSWRER